MHPGDPKLMVVSPDGQTRTEMTWALERTGVTGGLEWVVDPEEARDLLTTRVRAGGIPLLLVLDLRTSLRAGSEFLKWMGGTESLSQMVIVVLSAAPGNAASLYLLGADVVLPASPDHRKLRQLFGIADELAALRADLPATRPRPIAAPGGSAAIPAASIAAEEREPLGRG